MPDGSYVRDYMLDIADSHLRALEEIERVVGDVFNVTISSQLFQFGSAAHGENASPGTRLCTSPVRSVPDIRPCWLPAARS
jgi:hypothetical protein